MELISEHNGGQEFYDFIDRSIIGGICAVFQPRATASDGETIMSWDFNSLYPYILSGRVPVGCYRKVELSQEEFLDIVEHWKEDDSTGYGFEVDIHVPDHLHDKLDFAPFARMCSDPSTLSAKQQDTIKLLNSSMGDRLAPYLGDQSCVGQVIPVLQVFLKLGIEIRVVRAWSMRMEYVYRPIAQRLYEARLQATDEVEKDNLKLPSNSGLFGKTVENKGTRKNAVFLLDHDKWANTVNRPGGSGYWLCEEGEPFLGIGERPRTRPVVLDTARQLGWWALSAAKARMYAAWCFTIKPYYSLKDRTWILQYGDSDSLYVLVGSTTPEADMAEMNAGGVLFDNQLLGCLKDEGAAIAAKLS